MFSTRFLPLLAVTVLFGACATDPRLGRDTLYLTDGGGVVSVAPRGHASHDNISFWDGDGVPGAPFILVRLGEQRAYFYKGNELVGVSAISAGREGFNTKTGKFKVIQKSKDHVSSQFGDYVDKVTGEIILKDADTTKDKKPANARYDGAKMPYFMRVVGGIGLHAGFIPGYPASHGCIRMPEYMAEAFFNNVSLGTPVHIVQ